MIHIAYAGRRLPGKKARSEEEQSQTRGSYDRFSAALGCKLAQDSIDMKLYGVLADVQAVGNCLVGESLSEQLQDLLFARCQHVGR
jgi:hypothetical protein